MNRTTASPGAAIPSAGPDFEHLLGQEVVIEAKDGTDRTGAQAVEPGHSPRAAQAGTAPVARQLPVRGIVPRTAAEIELQREVEQLLYLQAELLDGKHWQAWIDLFDEQGVYWMPVTPEQVEWEGSPSIFAEDKLLMEIRKDRVSHPNAWSQAPMWETNHVVSHVVLESTGGGEVHVRSRFHMMELRRDTVRHFAGSYVHHLKKTRDGYRIKLQRVDMVNGQAAYDYVLQVWV